ncbi:MAG: type II toxin-antitoxin system RelE/ParE family toxin [bacterium]
MSKVVTLRLSEENYQRITIAAEAEHRPISNFITTRVLEDIETSSYVDPIEMAQILSDKKLLEKLRAGHEDAKKKEEGSLSDFKIFETNPFIKDIEQDFKGQQERIKKKFIAYVYPPLKQNPYFGKNIKKLKNYKPETWRYRIGDYRFFYEIDELKKIVYMIAADDRQNVYD